MRTVFFEEEMLKNRRSEVMKEYKSVQPKRYKNSQNSDRQFQILKILLKTWASFIQPIQDHRDEPEFEPADP